MTEKKPLQAGHIAFKLNRGQTQLMICDDICKEASKEEIESVLSRCAAIAARRNRVSEKKNGKA